MAAVTLALSNVPAVANAGRRRRRSRPRASPAAASTSARPARPIRGPTRPDWPPVGADDARDLPPRAARAVGAHRRAGRHALRVRRRSRRHLLRRRPRGGEGDRRAALGWSARPPLRAAGVGYVVARRGAAAAVRARSPCSAPERGVAVYRLDGAAPSVRVATRLFTAVTFEDVVPRMSRPGLRSAHGRGDHRLRADRGTPLPASAEVVEETTTRLRARVVAPAPALVVWSRTFFGAWRARVDGADVAVVVADGHLVGVPVPAGATRSRSAGRRAPVSSAASSRCAPWPCSCLLRRR